MLLLGLQHRAVTWQLSSDNHPPAFSPAAALHHGNSGPPFDCNIADGAGAASGKTVSPVDSTGMIVLEEYKLWGLTD